MQYTDPKFRNSDKSVSLSLQANEDDKLEDFGYKSNRVGSSFVTNFEYLDDLNFGLETILMKELKQIVLLHQGNKNKLEIILILF